jgi:hypothetical protein
MVLHWQQDLEHIRQLPLDLDPEVLGLHANAQVSCEHLESTTLLGSVALLRGKTTQEAKEPDQHVSSGVPTVASHDFGGSFHHESRQSLNNA